MPLRLEMSFDLFAYINRLSWTTASIFRLRSLSWCLTAFADFWSLNGNTILVGATCSSDQQNVVYHYKCGLCDTDYVGFTSRHLHQRVEEHKRSTIGYHV